MSKRGAIEVTPVHVENILAVWHAGGEVARVAGPLWYPAAYDTAARLAHMHGVRVEQAAGVIAALSPMLGWDDNLVRAELCLSHWARGVHPHDARSRSGAGLGLPNSILAAARVLGAGEGEVLAALGGDKVRSFFANVMGDTDAVTVDGHAVNIAEHGINRVGITKAANPKGAAYRRYAAAYREAAHLIGVKPSECQAGTWEAYRSVKVGGVL